MSQNQLIRLAKPSVPKLSRLTKAYEEILESGMLTNFKYVELFEKKCGQFLKNPNTVAVANATSGMLLAITVLKLEGEVIIPSFTYSSTGHVLLWKNLQPVFADIDRETFNLDPLDVEKKITKNTSAIFPVHCFGNPADIAAIQKIAKKYQLKVIYDAAHAFGSRYQGQSVTKFGDASIFSFTPTKALTTAEGGLVVVRDRKLVSRIKIGRENGDCLELDKEFLGFTARMAEFNAVLGLENLKDFNRELGKRIKLVNFYKQKLRNIPEISFQKVRSGNFSVYKDLVIVVNKPRGFRDSLLRELHKKGIQAKAYFSPPLHQKLVYRKYSRKRRLPITEWVAQRIISLPFYSNLKFSEANKVCEVVKNFILNSKKGV